MSSRGPYRRHSAQFKLQLPQIPVQPAPCAVMPLTGIPIAAMKFISLFFIRVSSHS